MAGQHQSQPYYRPIFWRLGTKRDVAKPHSYIVACKHWHASPSGARRCGYRNCEPPEGFASEHEVLCFEVSLNRNPRRLSFAEEQQAKRIKSPGAWEKSEAARLRRNQSADGGRKSGRDWEGRPYRVTLIG